MGIGDIVAGCRYVRADTPTYASLRWLCRRHEPRGENIEGTGVFRFVVFALIMLRGGAPRSSCSGASQPTHGSLAPSLRMFVRSRFMY